MNNEENNQESKSKTNSKHLLSLCILASAGILAVGMVYSASIKAGTTKKTASETATASAITNAVDSFEALVLPPGGVELPVVWGDIGKRMIEAGVIDRAKFEALYAQRGGMTQEMKNLLLGSENGKLTLTAENSGYVLNLLWALGLGQKSNVLINGPMMNTPSIKSEQFASTGGWTLASGNDVMTHYAKHNLLNLTAEQEKLVESVAKNIYRPCCGNSTYFPDCNHGMGMLGLLELMASQGANEKAMYRAALFANSYWFPDNYLTLASYFKSQGTNWDKVDPRVVLGNEYSSSGGFQAVASQAAAPPNNTIVPRKSSSGCGT